jgi:putative glycerol-1-phosphate prenyltransferase
MAGNMLLFEQLLKTKEEKGAGFFLLLDPDKVGRNRLVNMAEMAVRCGVDAILAGSSFVACHDFDIRMAELKKASALPVILFPGNSRQVTRHADAVLFLSLISGRNPTYLIEEQVRGAPLVKSYGLESIPTAYLLIESGAITSVQYVSNTVPIPRDKYDIAMAHALAARYMGMKTVYLEAGSGAAMPVPEEMITAVADYSELPVIVGGGIRRPEDAASRVSAGASFVVIGTRLEYENDSRYMSEMAEAIHSSVKTPI